MAKLPYLSLGDKQTNARMYARGGQQWYTVETIRSLVQMTGRHVRSASDHGITYILDEMFQKVWRQHRSLLPAWWREALVHAHPKRQIVKSRSAS